MRASPGLVTEAVMTASTTDAERIADAKAKEDKNSDVEVKKTGKKESKKKESEERCEDPDDVVLTVGSMVITSAKKLMQRW